VVKWINITYSSSQSPDTQEDLCFLMGISSVSLYATVGQMCKAGCGLKKKD